MDGGVLSHLKAADIFAVLAPDELAELAAAVEVQTLETDAIAVTQGDAGNSLFVVTAGRLSVFIADAEDTIYVGDLWPGEFFGEMALLTGTPRTATVKAIQPVTLIEVTKELLAPLLQRHPELASSMGQALSERQSSNLKTLMEFEPEQRRFEQERSAAQFSFRIRDFFDIPTTIWSKAVDGIGSFSFGGPLGFILGKPERTSQDRSGATDCDNREIAFTTALITLTAKMAASGGSYAHKEIRLLRELFDIPNSDMANVTRIFNRAQGNPRGYEPYARQIAEMFREQPAVLEELVVSLIRIAAAARSGEPAMLRFVEQISGLFGFTGPEFERQKSMGQHPSAQGANTDGPPYLTVLSLSPDATPQEAKRAYHKLAMENHPDKLMADGMPEEFIALANEKLVLINRAYEQFQAAMGHAR